jgi:subtilisin family serine protease
MEPIFRNPPIDKVEPVAASSLAETHDWSLPFLGIPPLWKLSEGEGVRVAVLDTGCDLDHPDLQGAVADAKDFSGSLWGVRDRQGHGTHCAGVIGARANDIGIRGIAPKCELLIGKVLGDDGSGTEDAIRAGLEWAFERGAHIVSMSLGGPRMSERLHDAIKAIVKSAHRFVICAAGNDGRANSVNYPAVWDETIAVAAVDENGRLTKFSSQGPQVDIAAPGANILSTVPITAGGYARMSGTSMATPIVAAIAALCLAKHLKQGGHTGLESWRDLQAHLRKTARDAGPVGPDTGYGYGIIDPAKLLDAVTVTPPVTPTPEGPQGVTLRVKDAAGVEWNAKKIDWERAGTTANL